MGAVVALLTTNANDAVKPIHNRMPVILPGPAEEELWLTGELDDVRGLLRPIDASRVTYQAANPALNKVGEAPEGPQLLGAPG